MAGYVVFGGLDAGVNAIVLALAAGGILAMVVDTMVPEAFSEEHSLSGMMTVLGFIVLIRALHDRVAGPGQRV